MVTGYYGMVVVTGDQLKSDHSGMMLLNRCSLLPNSPQFDLSLCLVVNPGTAAFAEVSARFRAPEIELILEPPFIHGTF